MADLPPASVKVWKRSAVIWTLLLLLESVCLGLGVQMPELRALLRLALGAFTGIGYHFTRYNVYRGFRNRSGAASNRPTEATRIPYTPSSGKASLNVRHDSLHRSQAPPDMPPLTLFANEIGFPAGDSSAKIDNDWVAQSETGPSKESDEWFHTEYHVEEAVDQIETDSTCALDPAEKSQRRDEERAITPSDGDKTDRDSIDTVELRGMWEAVKKDKKLRTQERIDAKELKRIDQQACCHCQPRECLLPWCKHQLCDQCYMASRQRK
ncbi:MAG: hypothetical protein Q9185_001483 [Variospora sp. 1 TL-2023]